MDQPICPKCKLPVLANFYFCPNCAKPLRDKPLEITIGKQISIYLLSALLPPLGLIPGIRYLMQKNDKSKMVGGIAIFLTIVSSAITIYFAIGLMGQINKQLNGQLSIPGSSQLQLNQNPAENQLPAGL